MGCDQYAVVHPICDVDVHFDIVHDIAAAHGLWRAAILCWASSLQMRGRRVDMGNFFPTNIEVHGRGATLAREVS